MECGEGKEYSCRNKAEQDTDLMKVDSPLGLINSIYHKHILGLCVPGTEGTGEMEKNKIQFPPLQEVNLV